MKVNFHTLYHCGYALNYHLVIVTKYRRKCITASILQRCEDWGGKLLEFNSEADHVHVLVELPPNLDLSRFVNNVKTTSSRLVRRDFADQLNDVYRGKPGFWSRSYCIVSCGGAPLSIVRQYVEQQKAPE